MVPMMVTFYASAYIGSTLGNMTDGTEANQAAQLLWNRLDAVVERHPLSESGLIPSVTNGTIDVREVRFAYPSAPDRLILRGCTLHIEAGHVCALVGPSGSGKSTIIQLLERFYDPSSGSVMLDGVDVRELNLRWLRSRLGLVGQEPVLFMGTVSENIAYGKPGASEEEVEAAAIKRAVALKIIDLMRENDVPKIQMARQMRTSRAALDRLLDPENTSVTLATLTRAAHALGKKVKIDLVSA